MIFFTDISVFANWKENSIAPNFSVGSVEKGKVANNKSAVHVHAICASALCTSNSTTN